MKPSGQLIIFLTTSRRNTSSMPEMPKAQSGMRWPKEPNMDRPDRSGVIQIVAVTIVTILGTTRNDDSQEHAPSRNGLYRIRG